MYHRHLFYPAISDMFSMKHQYSPYHATDENVGQFAVFSLRLMRHLHFKILSYAFVITRHIFRRINFYHFLSHFIYHLIHSSHYLHHYAQGTAYFLLHINPCLFNYTTGTHKKAEAILLLPFVLPRCIQHIFDKNPVAGIRLIDENMGHGTHQLAVLNDRTAAHE